MACMEGRRGAYTFLTGIPEGKTPLGRPTHRRDNIRNGSSRSGMRDMDWINLS